MCFVKTFNNQSPSHFLAMAGTDNQSHLTEQDKALDPSTLIERLSWRPGFISKVTCISEPPEPIKVAVLPRTLTSSSMGLLDIVPIELLHIILNSLDFKSLSRLTRACHQAKTMVESLPSYQDMMKRASMALTALSRTRLITFHSAATLHAALRSEECVSCQKYAPFLLLPTCERCCYDCLLRERSLRVITIQMAKTCFGVSATDLSQIPNMLSIRPKYLLTTDVDNENMDRYRVSLVSVKQAKQLGISIHKSEEAMERVSILKKAGDLSLPELCLARWLAGSTYDYEDQNSSLFMRIYGVPPDDFCGVASISFPSLRPNAELEHGLWCYGCKINSQNYSSTIDTERVLYRMVSRARSRSEFLEHTKDCKGTGRLLGWMISPRMEWNRVDAS